MNEYISLASSEGLPLDPVSSFSTDRAQPSVQQTPGVILLTSSLVSIFRTLTAFFFLSFFLLLKSKPIPSISKHLGSFNVISF